jgi:hypothetical protein
MGAQWTELCQPEFAPIFSSEKGNYRKSFGVRFRVKQTRGPRHAASAFGAYEAGQKVTPITIDTPLLLVASSDDPFRFRDCPG